MQLSFCWSILWLSQDSATLYSHFIGTRVIEMRMIIFANKIAWNQQPQKDHVFMNCATLFCLKDTKINGSMSYAFWYGVLSSCIYQGSGPVRTFRHERSSRPEILTVYNWLSRSYLFHLRHSVRGYIQCRSKHRKHCKGYLAVRPLLSCKIFYTLFSYLSVKPMIIIYYLLSMQLVLFMN